MLGKRSHSESTNFTYVQECDSVNQIMFRGTRLNKDLSGKWVVTEKGNGHWVSLFILFLYILLWISKLIFKNLINRVLKRHTKALKLPALAKRRTVILPLPPNHLKNCKITKTHLKINLSFKLHLSIMIHILLLYFLFFI